MEKITGKRIEELRKNLKLKQIEFAEKLGLTNSAISAIELEKAPLTESNIRLICLTFGVNDEWLRHGTGDMFKKEAQYKEKENRLFAAFRQLSALAQDMLIEFAEKLVSYEKNQRNGENGEKNE